MVCLGWVLCPAGHGMYAPEKRKTPKSPCHPGGPGRQRLYAALNRPENATFAVFFQAFFLCRRGRRRWGTLSPALVCIAHLAPEGVEADAQGAGSAFFAVLLAGQFLADDLLFHEAQTLAQERAQAEGVGAAYTKYVRPLLERAALGLSTALSPIPSVPGSEPGTGLAQAIETSNANYERNKTHDISGRPVHGQGVDAAGEFAYGNSRMKDSGCGVIGTYNALYLLGKDPSLAEVGRRYEISGAMAGGGAWGTNPYGAPQVLKQYGVQYEEYTDPDALEREAGEGDVMIVSIWNRKGTIFEGYHTFAVQKVNGELMVYNRFNNSAESTEKKTMGEVIENGQFIVGYRVQNAK